MGFDAHLKQNGHFISMFLEVRNLMSASALFYTFLLFHVTDSTSEKTLNYADSSNVYAPSWAIQLHSSANDDDANYIATILGLKYEKILPNNYYLLTDERNQDHVDKANEKIIKALESFPQVIWVEQQAVQHFDSRISFDDPLWNDQIHHRSHSSRNVIGQPLEKVWEEGYTGKGVTVIVIDNGVRGTHRELARRYKASISVDKGSSPSSYHGSYCAGVIAAEANNRLCGVGVAYGCNIGGIQLFVDGNASDSNEATAFYRENVNPSDVDIFSNSWGPSDNGRTVRGPGRLAREALKLGVERGRHGLGNIYVFSCGNGAVFDDSCAFDGYVNSIYTIAVASVERDGKVTRFSERCGAIMTAVYSTDMVTITGANDAGCYSNFGKTSAAGAAVSGILALALEANGNLTWRDMQHLVARSSKWDNVDDSVLSDTQRNGKNFTVNENFGFGVLDALTLVQNAKKWNASIPDQVMCTMDVTGKLGTRRIPSKINVQITENNLNCEANKLIRSLEHVQLRLDLEYENRAVIILDVTSPSRTTSRFLYPRSYDGLTSETTYSDLVVTSVHFWGESLLGEWKIDIKEDTSFVTLNSHGTLSKMSFIFFGTQEVIYSYENTCGTNRSHCHEYATCTDLGSGDYRCTCNEGFSGDGKLCIAVNTCGTPRDDCHEHATCTDVGSGSYTCTCNEGYTGNGKNCVEIICGTARDDCHENATCKMVGSADYKCTCNDGYTGSGEYCIEDDSTVGDGFANWKIILITCCCVILVVAVVIAVIVWYKWKYRRLSGPKPEPRVLQAELPTSYKQNSVYV